MKAVTPNCAHFCDSNTIMLDSVGDFQTHKEFGHSVWDFSFNVVGLLLALDQVTHMERSEQQNKVVLKARHCLLYKHPPNPIPLC